MTIVSDYTALLSGATWYVGAPGQAVFLTYSFSQQATANLLTTEPAGAATFTPFTDNEKAATRAALAQWSAVSGITFVETTYAEGDLTFGKYNLSLLTTFVGAAGLGNYPGSGGFIDSFGNPAVYGSGSGNGTAYAGGDIYIDLPTKSADSLLHILLHEIGHGLGLKHPFDGGAITLDPGLDSGSNTVMSYNSPAATTLGPLDIAAIQYLYGTPATATHTSNWSWNAPKETLTIHSTGDHQFVRGTGARDIIYAPGTGDAVVSAQGNDLIIASGQRLSVNGGSGIDTVETGLAYAAITLGGGVGGSGAFRYFYVNGNFALGSSWTFNDVEKLVFTDGISYDTTTNTAGPTSFDATITGAAGTSFTVPFDRMTDLLTAQDAIDPYNAALISGLVLPFTVIPGGLIPGLPAGKFGQLILHAGGSAVMPAFYNSAISNAATGVTLSGGSTNGQLVVAGQGGLAFNAGAGRGSVYAGGGSNLVSLYPGAGDQFIQLGNGNDTVIALAGNATIAAGAGLNQILTGSGQVIINSTGTDLIAAGDSGAATINAFGNNPTAFFGPGTTVFNAGSGHATVVSTVGRATINGAGGTQIWLGTNQDVVNSTGADTVIGNAGAATVNANSGNMFVFSGNGALNFQAGSGTSTILGNVGGTATLRGGSGSIIALSYGPTRYIGGSGADTIAGFGGSMTVTGGSGGGLFQGGPAGANSITGGTGQAIILGGGNGDVLHTGTGAGDVIQAGAGAATISAAGTNGTHKLYGGSGPDLILTGNFSSSVLTGSGNATIVSGAGVDLFAFANGNHPDVLIQNYTPSTDYLSLQGFPVGEMTAALAGATTSAGTQSLTLSDGTHITFQGFSGLTPANFL